MAINEVGLYKMRLPTFKKRWSNIEKIFLGLTILPIVFIGALIMHFGVNVPTFDQWELVTDIQKVDSHTLGISDLLQQHNEHRIAVPRTVMLGVGHFTHWDVIVEMFVSLGIQIVSFIIVWKIINRTLSGMYVPVARLLASVLMFNPMQWENWIWGWQIQWYLTILGAISALYFCWYMPLRRRRLNHLMAITSATVAMFSLAGGFIVWPCLLAFLAFRKQLTAAAVYCVFFVTEAAVYAKGYHSVVGHTPIDSLFSNQLGYFHYIFLYMGGGVTTDNQIAPIIGAISIGIFIFVASRILLDHKKKLYPWIALAIFVLANAALTGTGRFLLSPYQALASRYTSFSTLWLLSLIVITIPYIHEALKSTKKWLQSTTITTLTILLILFGLTSIGGIAHLRAKSAQDSQAKACLNTEIVPDSACISLVYPSSPNNDLKIISLLQYLRDKDLAGMHQPMQ
jgi:hypothetical protein